MKLSEILKQHREKTDTSLRDFADKSGLSRSYISKLEQDDTVSPTIPTLKKIAQGLDIDLDSLFSLLDDSQDIDLAHKKIKSIIPLQKARRIPILGTIACGEPIWAEQNYEGYFITDYSIKADFCLYVKGDSMIDAGIQDGDTVFLRRTPEVENGEIGAVLIEDEATLKRVYKTADSVVLQPCNSTYPPIFIDKSKKVIIIGKMIGIYHPTE